MGNNVGDVGLRLDVEKLEADLDRMKVSLNEIERIGAESANGMEAAYDKAFKGMSESVALLRVDFAAVVEQMLSSMEELKSGGEAAAGALAGLKDAVDVDDVIRKLEGVRKALEEVKNESKEAGSKGGTTFENLRDSMGFATKAFDTALEVTAKFCGEQETLNRVSEAMHKGMSAVNRVIELQNSAKKALAATTSLLTGMQKVWNVVMGQSKVALNAANVAAKGLMVTLTGGLSVALGFVMSLIDGFVQKQQEEIEQQREAKRVALEAAEAKKKAALEYKDGIVKAAGEGVAKVEMLSMAWKKLKTESEKNRFIRDNKKAFDELGFAISDVNDANNLLIGNKSMVVEALMSQAQAAAAMSLATDKSKTLFAKQSEAKDLKSKLGAADAVFKSSFKAGKDEESQKAIGSIMEYKQRLSELEPEIESLNEEIKGLFESSLESSNAASKSLEEAGVKTSAQAAAEREEASKRNAQQKELSENLRKTTERDLEVRAKANEAIRKAEAEGKRELQELNFKQQERDIEMMNDGAAKKLALLQLGYEKENKALEDWKLQQLDAYNEVEKQKAIAQGGEKAGANYVPTTDFSVLPEGIVEEAKRRSESMKAKLEADQKGIVESYKNSWTEWMSESDKIDQQIVANKQRAAQDIADIKALEKGGYISNDEASSRISSIETKVEIDNKGLEQQKAKLTDEWTGLFKDLETMSKSEVKNMVSAINAKLADTNIKLPTADKEALLNKLSEAQKRLESNNPFGRLAEGVKKYAAATTAADKEIARADLGKAASESASAASESVDAVSGMLGSMGVDVPPIVQGISSSLSAVAEIDWKNPVSIAVGGIKAITSLVKGIFDQADARIEAQMQKTRDTIASTRAEIEKLQEAADNSYGFEAADNIMKQGEEYQKQLDSIRESQAVVEDGKDNKKNKERMAELNAAELEALKGLDEYKQRAQDALFGEDIKSAISNFTSAFTDAWSSGELSPDFGKKMVDNMIKQVIGETLKSRFAERIQKLRDMIAAAMEDGVLTEQEYADIMGFADDITRDMEKETSGYERILNKDKEEKADEDTKKVSGGGFEGITQETGGKLDGKFSLMLENQIKIIVDIGDIKDILKTHLSNIADNLEVITKNSKYLVHLVDIKADIASMKGMVDNIEGYISKG